MKTTLTALALCLCMLSPVTAQDAAPPSEPGQEPPVVMARYVVVVLRDGPDATADSAAARRISQGHMANIRAMGDTGKLLTAGPVGGAEGVQGIFVFTAGTTREEVEALIAEDPAIREGWLVPELWEWYSPAGLGVVPPGTSGGER